MTPKKLSVFVSDRGQDEAAKLLGSSQAAICKALKSGRVILVSEDSPGVYSALEVKGFPSCGPSQQPAPNLEHIIAQLVSFGQHPNRSVHTSSTRQPRAAGERV